MNGFDTEYLVQYFVFVLNILLGRFNFYIPFFTFGLVNLKSRFGKIWFSPQGMNLVQ